MPDSIQGPVVFVSNFDLNNRKGGFDGLGGKIYDALHESLDRVILFDKINPRVLIGDKLFSKLFRAIGIPAQFPAFSSSRLDMVKQDLTNRISSGSSIIFFHGITPWISYRPRNKYYAFTDCSFETYIDKYHKKSLFSTADIKRIVENEKRFMQNAECIFFSSQWALEETKRGYNLDGRNFKNINQGPLIDLPGISEEVVIPDDQFLFIGLDFYGKGGDEICRAFGEFNASGKKYKLLIVGQKPPDKYLRNEDIEYLGYINKYDRNERERLLSLYRRSKALLLFTQKDIAPVVIIEAGLFGCPTIANKHCAISEMIVDGKTGYLINKSGEELMTAMNKISQMDNKALFKMRSSAKDNFQKNYSWEDSINSILETISL
jgi:glycosyltransferase involved in cell wall biosynthesis